MIGLRYTISAFLSQFNVKLLTLLYFLGYILKLHSHFLQVNVKSLNFLFFECLILKISLKRGNFCVLILGYLLSWGLQIHGFQPDKTLPWLNTSACSHFYIKIKYCNMQNSKFIEIYANFICKTSYCNIFVNKYKNFHMISSPHL